MRFWSYHSEFSSEIYFTEKKDKSMIRIFPQSQNPRIEQFLPTHFGLQYFQLRNHNNVSFHIAFYLKNKVIFYIIKIKLVRK